MLYNISEGWNPRRLPLTNDYIFVKLNFTKVSLCWYQTAHLFLYSVG